MILKPLKGKEEGEAQGTTLVSWLDLQRYLCFSFLSDLKHTSSIGKSVSLPQGPKRVKEIRMSNVTTHIKGASYNHAKLQRQKGAKNGGKILRESLIFFFKGFCKSELIDCDSFSV